MDLANDVNGLVIGTGDFSELALGWATYNGDHMSMYDVNADIPKTMLRHLVKRCADTMEAAGEGNSASTMETVGEGNNSAELDATDVSVILYDILATPISPELLPPKDGEIAQCTEDVVGPYELHDFYLYYCLRYGYGPRKIYRLACAALGSKYSAETILKWERNFFKRFINQQYKRSCMPDGPAVGSVGLSPREYGMPSDASYAVWMQELDEIR